MGGPATKIVSEGTAGAKYNSVKDVHFIELTECNALFHDRAIPAVVKVSGEGKSEVVQTIKPEVPGKTWPAVLVDEKKSLDAAGFEITEGELRVNFGGAKGWETVMARRGARKEGFWYEPKAVPAPVKESKEAKK